MIHEVTLYDSWHELFGEQSEDFAPKERKGRWAEWKRLVVEAGDLDILEEWTSCEETCSGCVYRVNDWCNYASLPCAVNPILTMQMSIKGMACQGVGYKKIEFVQTQLF